jgi:pyruvate dehydrogenase E2 component (dihydrolipoamide acetyltransferase)
MATFLEQGEAAPPAEAAAATARPAAPAASPPARPVSSATADAAVIQAAITTHKPSSPAARQRARELGIDIEQVQGSGPHGVIIIADVDKAAAGTAAPHPPPAPSPPAPPAPPAAILDRRAEMRKAIAAAMARSKREIPHYYLGEAICMHKALDWLTSYNARHSVTERILMSALQLKAVALCLRHFPELNGYWRDDAFQPATGIHVGVAISLRQGGLIAPAIHDVDQKPLPELMLALSDLVTRVRSGSLRSSEMSDATVTVTNLGEQGVESVFGVIYPPQVALIGFGRLNARPWVEDKAIAMQPVVTVQPVVTASLAADHRVSDGHRGARFLAALNEALQYPEDLL